mmetsp:Transcript_14447/g.41534  ORF Transcript_14447/g.41534 Transcript_14447/m.41534 type:complete len:259 (-) Transcript_14447:320-1096(-)
MRGRRRRMAAAVSASMAAFSPHRVERVCSMARPIGGWEHTHGGRDRISSSVWGYRWHMPTPAALLLLLVGEVVLVLSAAASDFIIASSSMLLALPEVVAPVQRVGSSLMDSASRMVRRAVPTDPVGPPSSSSPSPSPSSLSSLPLPIMSSLAAAAPCFCCCCCCSKPPSTDISSSSSSSSSSPYSASSSSHRMTIPVGFSTNSTVPASMRWRAYHPRPLLLLFLRQMLLLPLTADAVICGGSGGAFRTSISRCGVPSS